MARFERAIRTANPTIVLAAAHELPKPIQLRDALRVLLVLATAAPDRFPRAAARFGARLIGDCRLSVAEAQLALAALHTLADPNPTPGGEALCALLELHHQPDAARYLEHWLQRF